MIMRYTIATIIVVLLIVGGFFAYKKFMTQEPSPTGDPVAQAPVDLTNIPQDQVQGQDVVAGTGTEATAGSVVSVLYVGRFSDGTVFDSSEAHGNQPLVFELGSQGLIPGFQIGVNGMKVGGERRIVIPAPLGYGTEDVKDETGKVIIPANSVLVFDLKLIDVKAAPAQE